LDSSWSVTTTNTGRVAVATTYPYAGSYSLLLDSSVDGTDSIAAAILTQDLTGESDVIQSWAITGLNMGWGLGFDTDGAVASDFDLGDVESWLSEDPVTGTVSADSFVDVAITFTALPTMTNGIYTATLKVNADDPFTSSYKLPMTMTVVSSPTCGFVSSSPDTVGETTTFTNTSTGSNPMTYRWNFGDGSPISAATDPTHAYAQVGSYTTVLTVENSYGPSVCSDTVDIVLPTYMLMVNKVGSGTVTLDPTGGVYDENTTVTLTATADPGWYFNGPAI